MEDATEHLFVEQCIISTIDSLNLNRAIDGSNLYVLIFDPNRLYWDEQPDQLLCTELLNNIPESLKSNSDNCVRRHPTNPPTNHRAGQWITVCACETRERKKLARKRACENKGKAIDKRFNEARAAPCDQIVFFSGYCNRRYPSLRTFWLIPSPIKSYTGHLHWYYEISKKLPFTVKFQESNLNHYTHYFPHVKHERGKNWARKGQVKIKVRPYTNDSMRRSGAMWSNSEGRT